MDSSISNFIAKRIQQYYSVPQQEPFISPTLQLDAVVNDLAAKLKEYQTRSNSKDSYIKSQSELIWKLHLIEESLQMLEPFDIWSIIHKKIQHVAMLDESDIVYLYFPLKIDAKDLEKPRIAIVDLVGWNFENTYDYGKI